MEEIRLSWPNGGMGNTVYCLLHLCTNEFYHSNYNSLIEKIPTDGSHWHSISGNIIKNNIIIDDHFGYDTPGRILVSSKNVYFITLMSWYKWQGIPKVSYGKDLELLVKMLNHWKPAGDINNINFEILNLFENRDLVKKFILNFVFTINEKFNFVVDLIVKNNQKYYNEIKYLENVVTDSLQGKDKIINLYTYQQAIIMSMIEKKLEKSFRLVHNSFNNTQSILSFLEK